MCKWNFLTVLLSIADFVDLKPYKKGKYMYFRSFRSTTIFKILEEEIIKEWNITCEH